MHDVYSANIWSIFGIKLITCFAFVKEPAVDIQKKKTPRKIDVICVRRKEKRKKELTKKLAELNRK